MSARCERKISRTLYRDEAHRREADRKTKGMACKPESTGLLHRRLRGLALRR